jgi:outer membrane protein assembly factor BamB
MSRISAFVLAMGLLFVPTAIALAAVITGNVEAVSAGNNSITVRIESQKASKSFKLSPTAKVTIDGKRADLDSVQIGQTATVTTDTKGEQATKVAIRSTTTAPAAKPAPKTERPKATAKTTPNARTETAASGDWPQHRGPNRDNISTETGLLKQWPGDGPALVWTAAGLGEGYSAVAVVGDTIYTCGTRDRQDTLFALDAGDGRIKWSTPLGRLYQDGTGNGPRGTPTVDGDRIYALGGNGDLVCANAATGDVVWKQNILQEYGGSNITWGISESVLIDEDRLICTPGGRDATMVALDKFTGRPVWKSAIQGSPKAAYSSPIAINVGNVRQYVNYVHTAVVGVRASDGEPLWGQQASANPTANCSTPVAANNVVFTASGYGTGGALFRLASAGNGTRSEVAYTTKEMKNHHGGMVLIDGFLYGFDEAILTCLDLRSGKPAWQNRSVGKGSLTYAEGHLYLRSENGPVALAAASSKGYDERGRFEPANRSQRPAWSHPVISHGRLYLRDQDTLAVYDVKAR